MMSHHIYSILKISFENSSIQTLIDPRPSVIKNRPFTEAIEIIMNPRLSSGELLKKFGNQHRILENVCTYYFENFLSL